MHRSGDILDFDDFLKDVNAVASPIDAVRRKYLKPMSWIMRGHVMWYYSGWLQKPGVVGTEISDVDLKGFEKAMDGYRQGDDLHLILHTPGGDVAAAESIINYVRKVGGHFDAHVPELCMSSGTVIACCALSVSMARQARLGHIDSLFGGISAKGVVEEFGKAIAEVKKDPGSLPVWQTIIGKYHPAFIGQCESAVALAKDIVAKHLKRRYEFGMSGERERFDTLVDYLINGTKHKKYSRYLDMEKCNDLGFYTNYFDQRESGIRDKGIALLKAHQAYMYTFANTPALKIIENQNGDGIVINSDQVPAKQKTQPAVGQQAT